MKFKIGDPDPTARKKLTVKEARLKVLAETQISAFQKLFETLPPSVKEGIRPDYDIFMNTVVEIYREYPKGDFVLINELERRLPGNKWLAAIKKQLENLLPPPPQTEDGAREWQEAVKKKIKGEDIN